MKRTCIYVVILFSLILSNLISCYDKDCNSLHPTSATAMTLVEKELEPLQSISEPKALEQNDKKADNTESKTRSETEEPNLKAPFKYLYKYVSDEELASLDTLIKGVPLRGQFPDFPTGCESVAAVNLMNFYGVDISVDDFIDNKLQKNSNFYFKNGKMHGPSPYEYFLGDPRSNNSWGCMAPVIENAMKKSTNMTVTSFKSKNLETLSDEYVSKGHPVIVWVSIHMLEVSYTSSWYLDGETVFHWPNNEHCMILIGYDDWYYYFNDPYVAAIVRYKKDLAEDRFEKLGMQAIVLSDPQQLYK